MINSTEAINNIIAARIVERGNGFPSVGDYVPSPNGNLYRVEYTLGPIQTTGLQGNWCETMVSEADWRDCPEGEEHSSRCVIVGDENS